MPESVLPPCPHLPLPGLELDWRHLHLFQADERGGRFYFACLEYGQVLWQRRLPARAMLCLDRAFGADLRGDEPELQLCPAPYAAMAWIMAHAPEGVFLGNPRVHFQHYAGRMNEPRKAQRAWRSWACWALARVVRPQDPGDPRHEIQEPTLDEIAAALTAHGLRGEVDVWRAALEKAGQ
ncbi:MAG: hypothetical protein RL324_1353 [Verrucomicrobiota bacterium]|jgi:hypothetical protein